MPCLKAYRQGVVEFGCGRCLSCRISRKKQWKHRILLEAENHAENSFLTLTYSDKYLPGKNKWPGGTLDPEDLKRFNWRLRTNIQYENEKAKKQKFGPVRYFFVGEYGDETSRAHYHAALFGIACRGDDPTYFKGKVCSCESCELIRKTWSHRGEPMGHISLGTLTNDSASYIAGYVQKMVKVKIDGKEVLASGLTNGKDERVKAWLNGRHPEFTRMSRRPHGIGGAALEQLESMLRSRYGRLFMEKNGDVPHLLLRGGQQFSVGRYLREKLRQKLNLGTVRKTSFKDWKHDKEGNLLSEKTEISYRSPPGTMYRLSQKAIEESEKIHAKANKIKKNKYKYEEEVKRQKVRNIEVRTEMNAKRKQEI
jgi:hypothetical protein